MNIEIANQLLRLRKQHGYSQERLAEKLGISRQAVSKWERAEASPDTGNLVMLAKLYGVSLDELLLLVPIDDVREPQAPPEQQEPPQNIVIDVTGVAGKVKKAVATLGRSRWFNFPYIIIAVILFVVMGYLLEDGWWYSWMWIVSVPVYYSLGLAVERKNGYFFLYPVLVTIVYVGTCLVLEFKRTPALHLWDRLWVLYLTCFLYYYMVYYIRKRKRLSAEAEAERAGASPNGAED